MSDAVTIRLKADSNAARQGSAVVDQNGDALALAKGNTLTLQIGCFSESAFQDLSNVASMTVEFKAVNANENTTALVSAISGTDFTITATPSLANWKAGTAQHAEVTFSAEQTNTLPEGEVLLCIWTLDNSSPAKNKTYLSARVTIREDGCGVSTTAPDPAPSYYTAVQIDALLAARDSDFDDHVADTDNPHSVTATQLGLGNVDNTADADKPISTAQQTEFDTKADKDGSNLEAESVAEGTLSAAVQAKLNARNTGFEAFFNPTTTAIPVDTTASMAAYTADQSFWQANAATGVRTVLTCVADVSDSLDQKYLRLDDADGSVAVWADVDDSGSVAPSHGLDRAIEVTAIVTNDSASAVATAYASAINGDSKFFAVAVGDKVYVVCLDTGVSTAAVDGDTGFTFASHAAIDALDVFVWNSGTAGLLVDDFDHVQEYAQLPADGSLARAKIDSSFESDIETLEDKHNVSIAGTFTNHNNTTGHTDTGFELSSAANANAKFGTFEIKTGDIVEIIFTLDSTSGLGVGEGNISLRESIGVTKSTYYGTTDSLDERRFQVGENRIRLVATGDSSAAYVWFFIDGPSEVITISDFTAKVVGSLEDRVRDLESAETVQDAQLDRDLDAFDIAISSTFTVWSGSITGASTTGFTSVASTAGAAYIGEFRGVTGNQISVTFNCDDDTGLDALAVYDLVTGDQISNAVGVVALTEGTNAHTLTLTADADRCGIAIFWDSSNAGGSILDFSAKMVGTIEARLELAETLSSDNETAIGQIREDIRQLDERTLPPFNFTGIKSTGQGSALTMPAQDFGTGDFTVRVVAKRVNVRLLLWTNASGNTGMRLWWEEDGSFTFEIGNGSNFTTHQFATTGRAYIAQGQFAEIVLSADRDADAIIVINGNQLKGSDDYPEYLDISAASAQTVSTAATWYFLSDGTAHYPGELIDCVATIPYALNLERIQERAFDRDLWRRSNAIAILILQSDFSVGEDRWAADEGAVVGAQTANNESGWLKVTPNTSNTTHTAFLSNANDPFPYLGAEGDVINMSAKAYLPSGQSVDMTWLAMRLFLGAGSPQNPYIFEAAVTQDSPIRVLGAAHTLTSGQALSMVAIYPQIGDPSSFAGDDSSHLFVKDVRLWVETGSNSRAIDLSESGITKSDVISGNDGTSNATGVSDR